MKTALPSNPIRWAARPSDKQLMNGLARGECHVYAVELSAQSAPAVVLEILSPDEREKAARFRFDADRSRYAVAQGALRLLLARYLDDDGAHFQYNRGRRGKPHLGGRHTGALEFNLSHAGNIVLIALARTRIGVDVEPIDRRMNDMEGIAERVFSDREHAEWMQYSEVERRRAFFRCWTRKEAFIKATGDGMWSGLRQFDVSLNADGPLDLVVRQADHAHSPWTLHDLDPAEGYCAALVVDGGPASIKCAKFALNS